MATHCGDRDQATNWSGLLFLTKLNLCSSEENWEKVLHQSYSSYVVRSGPTLQHPWTKWKLPDGHILQEAYMRSGWIEGGNTLSVDRGSPTRHFPAGCQTRGNVISQSTLWWWPTTRAISQLHFRKMLNLRLGRQDFFFDTVRLTTVCNRNFSAEGVYESRLLKNSIKFHCLMRICERLLRHEDNIFDPSVHRSIT